MQISNYLKMNYDELAKEIEKQNKKIKAAQETIKLLKKLQIAETANTTQKKPENRPFGENRFYEGENQ